MEVVQKIQQIAKTYSRELRLWSKSNYDDQIHLFPMFSKMEKHELLASYFLSINNKETFCKLLRTPPFELLQHINNSNYQVFSIPKKNGGKREITAPNERLKEILRCLNVYLQAYYKCLRPECVYGFVSSPNYAQKYCNIAENAKNHIGKKYLLNIDLKDFFPNISAKRVKGLFFSPYFAFPDSIAMALTLLTTYQGKLPIGSPTSPVISNFICLKLDATLSDFCLKNGLNYTRYADDLSFSSDMPINEEVTIDLLMIIHQNGFIVNPKKIHRKTNNQQQIVTGLVVNQKVNIQRKLLKKIRAMLHDLTHNGWAEASERHFGYFSERNCYKFLNKLDGYINFIGQIRGKTDRKYLTMKSDYEKFLDSLK